MSDPLGLIGSGGGSGGIERLHGLSGPGGAARGPGGPVGAGAPNFKDVLLQNINEVNKLQQEAATAIEDLATGQREDLEGVMLATQKADAAFRALVAVRNKVQQAYEEIKQMRV
ncbi:MAG: flagellar hook-basal body complex protein FliE [Phycisphaeraceae bacterium]|nr:flagellar hook-basal body complex protein FliE [Phycisphaeraceae bacterium]